MAMSVGGPPNKRMKLTIALAPPPRSTSGGGYACPPFGGHRALAAYPRCSTDVRNVAHGRRAASFLMTAIIEAVAW